ncbi:MAG: hypothetical protein CML68_20430 [Rhodobacteraceae bacterium]|nr:hypothetical protein [Paracoccaceae bacterium]
MSGPVETARAAWGDAMPGWIERLAIECETTSQNRVANRMNRSASLVSAVLRNKYRGDMAAVEEIVRGTFERATVTCPARGTIAWSHCREWQQMARVYSNVNSERQRMYRACNGCPRNRKDQAT